MGLIQQLRKRWYRWLTPTDSLVLMPVHFASARRGRSLSICFACSTGVNSSRHPSRVGGDPITLLLPPSPTRSASECDGDGQGRCN